MNPGQREALGQTADAAEADVRELRAVLSGAGFRVAPALHGEPALWCQECGRDSGYHWAQCSKVSPFLARSLELVAERDAARALLGEAAAMLERCLPGRTSDGYDGGLAELALSAECERKDHTPGSERFFANKVAAIHREARDLVRRIGEWR